MTHATPIAALVAAAGLWISAIPIVKTDVGQLSGTPASARR